MGCWNSQPAPAADSPLPRHEARATNSKGLKPYADLHATAKFDRASPSPAPRFTPLSGPTSITGAGSSQETSICPRTSKEPQEPQDVTIEEVQLNLKKWQAQIPSLPALSAFSSGTPSSRGLKPQAGGLDEEAAHRSGTPSSRGFKPQAGGLDEEAEYRPTHDEIVKQLEGLELQISSHGTSVAGSLAGSRLPSRKNTQRSILTDDRLRSRTPSTIKIQNLATTPPEIG